MISEETIEANNSKEEKPITVPMSNSSNELPTVSKKKAVSSSMTEILGLSKQPQVQKKTKQQIEEDELLARRLAEEYNRYDMNNYYNSFRNF